MKNKYFDTRNQFSEQFLVEDLISEAIDIQGFSCYYIPRNNLLESDLLYGDDPLKSFSKTYLITAYLSESMDVRGNDLFSKFGLQIPNTTKIQVSRRNFKRDVPYQSRPNEGDLIFVPFMSKNGEVYEINFIDDTVDLYSLTRSSPYTYEISLELFKPSQEVIDTGIVEIDTISTDDSYNIDYTLYNGSGDYVIGEVVTDGSANNTAVVSEWNYPNSVIKLINLKGSFNYNANLIGSSSNTTYMISTFDDLIMETPHSDSDNNEIRDYATPVINTIISNPIGRLGKS